MSSVPLQQIPSLSVIIPAYNEEHSIEEALGDVLNHVATVVPDVEIIVVNDGSRDRTADLVVAFAAAEPRVKLLNQPNQGHGPALANGLAAARGEWLFLIDSDCQVSLEDFRQHWAMRANYDAILGLRRPRHDPFHRLVISAAMRQLLRLRLGVLVGDGGAPYKLVRADIWHRVQQSLRERCWIPSVLLAAHVLQQRDLKVTEIPVRHRERSGGQSTLNLRRLARFCREGAADISFYRERTRQRAALPADD